MLVGVVLAGCAGTMSDGMMNKDKGVMGGDKGVLDKGMMKDAQGTMEKK